MNKYIDHTILKADAQLDAVKKVCDEAKKYDFASVCINPCNVKYVAEQLQGSDVKTCVVVGFPLGANTTETKVFETKDCIKNGADEVDMVINVAKLKDKQDDYVYNEIKSLKEACGDKVLKVIIETCYLSDEEKKRACELSVKAGADFVKTSTGFGTGGATFDDVKLMKDTVGDKAQVKASGGVRDYETAKKHVDLGATRLGTSSGVVILEGGQAKEGTY